MIGAGLTETQGWFLVVEVGIVALAYLLQILRLRQ